jgi:C1A family cysteine protease
MNADRNVTATFSTIQYTIAISANPEAGGTVTGGGIYNHGETVNLTAVANRDYRFVNWTEAGIQVSTNSNYSFTARSDRTLVANFEEEVETGAFKVANSWGIGGWENVPDGFLYITYEAMKMNRVICFITDPRNGYEPRAIAVFEISHPVRDDCHVYVGVGDPASPLREKSFDVYDPDYRGGPLPFPENKMVLDITELLPFNNETVYLKVSDSSKTSSTGTIESFSVEVYNNYPSGIPTGVFTSTQTPKNTVNNSSVNVQIPGVVYTSNPFYDFQYGGGAGISPELLARLKEQLGIYEEGVNYNEIIDGFGTGLRPPTEEEWEEISTNWREAKGFITQDALPAMIDYSSSIYFPPIGNQGSEGSCVAFSIGYYVSTFYEARDRGWNLSEAQWVGDSNGSPTNSYQNRIFSPDFIYHQINNGVDEGAHYVNAMKVISNIGISSWKEMPYSTSDHTSWPSEPAWREAPRYRSYSSVMEVLQITSDKDILTLKSYVNSGYLISISIDANKYSSMTSSDVWNSYNYTNVRTNHANTIVGYDDSMSR